MDSAELDFNNTLLSSSSITSSNLDDYDKDLRLAAELGRYLLERNQELQNYISVLQQEVDDKKCEMKLLHGKFVSMREQLSAKCKQAEIIDAANFDLEQELILQRRENEKHRRHIKELFDLYEKARKQCSDIENEYRQFRTKQFSSYFTFTHAHAPRPSVISHRRQRSNSMSDVSPTVISSPVSSNIFDSSSANVFKTHLSDLKHRIQSLTDECTKLNDHLHQSQEDKRCLLERIAQLERQRRDDNDSLQNEVNHYRKLYEKYSNENNKLVLSNIYSPPGHELSLYEEVLLESHLSKSLYEPTNYKDLFACVYEKLKMNVRSY